MLPAHRSPPRTSHDDQERHPPPSSRAFLPISPLGLQSPRVLSLFPPSPESMPGSTRNFQPDGHLTGMCPPTANWNTQSSPFPLNSTNVHKQKTPVVTLEAADENDRPGIRTATRRKETGNKMVLLGIDSSSHHIRRRSYSRRPFSPWR